MSKVTNEFITENISQIIDKNTENNKSIKDIISSDIEKVNQIRERLKQNNSRNLNEDGSFNTVDTNSIEIITLKDCVNIVDGFINGDVSLEQLDDFGQKMTIRSYIPLLEKMSLLMQVLTKHEISATESTEIKMAELYKDIFFTIVMGAYGLVQINVLNDEDRALMTYENYDKLFPLFNQYILTYCKEDYDIFMSMLKDSINFNGVMNIVNALENIDNDKITESVQNNAELIKGLQENKELISDMKEIMFATDSNVNKIVQGMKQIALDEIKSKEDKRNNASDSEDTEISETAKMKVRDLIEKTKVELEQKKMQEMINTDVQIKNSQIEAQPKKRRGRPKKGEVVKVEFGKDENEGENGNEE